jgi:hypothetical protein
MKATKDREISELETKTVVVDCDADKAVNVSFNMILSCIDGKVAGHIHYVCMQRCVCCEAKPKKNLKIDYVSKMRYFCEFFQIFSKLFPVHE